MNISQTAAQIGTLLGGLSSLVAIATAFYEFRRYRKQRRSEAAIRAYSAVQSCLDYTTEIAHRPELYQIQEYYPFKFPEVRLVTEKHKERPAQLIINRIYECKQDMYESMAIIAGKERKELLLLLEQMQKAASTLVDDLYCPLKKDVDCSEAYEHIDKVQARLTAISKQIFDLLTPIIEGKL